MCRIESQKAMKCVPFAVNACTYEMLFLTCAEYTSVIPPVSKTQDHDLEVDANNHDFEFH